MTRCVLLVSTATRWLGTARMPRVLARAGFDVALLAPAGSLAETSRYVSRIGLLATDTTPLAWVRSLLRMIDAVAPEMLVPCDEMALRLLFTIMLDPPPGLSSAQRARLERLIAGSLGDPHWFSTSIDKTLLPAAATALGVRVPHYAIAGGVEEAIAHSARIGFPVVLKRRFGFAGEGNAIVATLEEAAPAAARLLSPDALDLDGRLPPQLLVQAWVEGDHHSQAMVALEGAPLASFAWDRFVSTAPTKGQTSVLRFVDSPETRDFAERLCRGFSMSGFFNVQFILDTQSGEAHLLEINRRIVTHMHLGERVGCDLGQALFNALEGRPVAQPVPRIGADDTVAIFPREWLRDPASPYLARYPVDVPWDEPRLMAAMVAMWREA